MKNIDRAAAVLPYLRNYSRTNQFYCLLIVVVLSLYFSPHAYALELQCSFSKYNHGQELQAIKKLAPDIVVRRKNMLTVKTSARPYLFYDFVDPYNGDDSERFFCDRKEEWLLIGGNHFGADLSRLINIKTGQIYPAAEYVHFSRDKRQFMTLAGLGGCECKTLNIHDANGHILWMGTDVQLRRGKHFYVNATVTRFAWSPSNELTGIAECFTDSDIKWPVKLTGKDNHRKWLPYRECPKDMVIPYP